MKEKILKNSIRCKKCGTTLESKHVHDFVMCSCGACGVDGGREYLRRIGNIKDMIELSQYVKVPPERCQCPIEHWQDVQPGHKCYVCGGMQ